VTTETESIAELAVAAEGKPTVIKTKAGREYLVHPTDMVSTSVSEQGAIPKPLPDHIEQGVTLQTVDSLVDYTNRFRTADTVLFADIDTNTIVSAIDYHAPTKASHVDHKARLTLPHSVEWKTWVSIHDKLMPQLMFARFLEENAADIVEPMGADLLEACRDLQAVRKVNFTKAVRTATDNENFEYTDETEARTRGGVELPKKFALSLPVYFGGAETSLYAFLRWKLDEGQLTLGVALHRHEHVRQAVFKQLVLDAAERTDRPAVFGKL
jgi:uncharacterized protein YfdQ (DUF2303 family)